MLRIQSAKKQVGGKWHAIPLEPYAGRPILHLFQEFDGRTVVAEVLFAGKLFYLCGTKELKNRMKIKENRSCTFVEAIAELERMCPDLLFQEVSR